tara:strand:- start:2645 stop:3142 length:498 start_codon:yes stop_codon:yes gene_type:complete
MAISNFPQNQASFAINVIPSDTINIPQPYIVRQSANTSNIGFTLIDAGGQFLGDGTRVAAIQEGDVVYNTTTGDVATVASVDSDSQLTLSAAIFTATPQNYQIYQGNSNPNSFLLYVGTGGDISIETSAAASVVLKNVGNASFIPINTGRVNASNTTATDIIALL